MALGVAAFSLAACGRGRTAPSPRPGRARAPAVGRARGSRAGRSVLPAPQRPATHEQAQKTGFDASGNPIAPPSERKSFFLDFLLQ